jgi:hypothetical protein
MATTTNFGWTTPDDTDLVKDGAAAIRTLGSSIDTSLVDLKGGTTGQVLTKASGTDLDFSFTTPAGSPITTEGDLIIGDATGDAVRLPIGSAGTVLTSDGDTADWAAPAVAGMTLLSTTAITAVQEVSITSISQDYNMLIVVLENAATSGTGVSHTIGFNANTGAGIAAYVSRGTDGGFADDFNSATATRIQLSLNTTTTANTNSITSAIYIPRYTNTTRKSLSFQTAAISSSSSTQSMFWGAGSFLGAAAISSVQLRVSSGTWTAQGNIYIYGVK